MDFDIIIVGGGLVGSALICALHDQGFRIALIDKNEKFSSPIELESPERVQAKALALSDVSIRCLKVLEIWSKIANEAEPIREVHVSKQGHLGITRLSAEQYHLPALGYVVNAAILEQIFKQALKTIPDLSMFCSDEIMMLEKTNHTWTVHLKSKKILTTKLLVAADGSESYLRKHQGIGVDIVDYQQTAIVANIELTRAHKGVAFERFIQQGSIAMLPFGENRVKSVLALPTKMAKIWENSSESAFLANIQANFGYRLGCLMRMHTRVSYPLRQIRAEALYSDRVVLVGNAANTLHPIAAQGFNLGLRDAAALAEILVSAKNNHQDIGSVEILQIYANARRTDHGTVRQFTHRMAEPSQLLGMGILGCEWIPRFKNWVIERGLGRQENLPKLCRGIPL